MKNSFFISALFSLLLANSVLSQTAYSPFSLDVSNTLNQPKYISDFVDGAQILNLRKDILNDLINRKDNKIDLAIPLDNGLYVSLSLDRFDILTPDAKVVAGTDEGDKEIDIRNRFIAYLGNVSGFENSTAVIIFFRDYVSGMLVTGKETYVLGEIEDPQAKGQYILYQTSKLRVSHSFNCGSEVFEVPQRILDIQRSLSGNIYNFQTSTFLKAEVAVESDYETFLRYGSVDNATRYLLSLMTMVSAVYIRDVNVRLTVPYIRVWSTSNDPYTGTTSYALLNEFRSYWNANMQNVSRTIAHYISTRSGNLGGVAWLNVLCASVSSGYGYAFSNINGSFNYLPAYSWDVNVVAHETGHNFGSPHTHNCGWPGGPIDTCYQVEGGCYSGPLHPRIGTIMSYCHLNASVTLDFGPLPSELIRTNAEVAPCMVSAGNFYLAIPNGGEILHSGINALIIWGTSVTGNVNIEYSVNNGSTWSTIQNNVPATDRNYLWNVPYIPTTTQAKVRVYESGNPANGDLSDSVFQIRPTLSQFNLISPPQLTTLFTSPIDTTPVDFIWTKAGTLPELNYKWMFSNMNYTLNLRLPSNNSGTDSTFTIRTNRLDSIVASWGVVMGDSIRCRWYVKVFSQLDSGQSNPGNFLINIKRQIVGVEPISSKIPAEFYVGQNYPNPFNPVTRIEFGLPKPSFVKIKVYDITGREVAVLANTKLDAGSYEVPWNAVNYPSGVYFYRIEAEEFVMVKKMVLVK